jgi:hypothetical protein
MGVWVSFGWGSRTPGYNYFLVNHKKSDGVEVDCWTWKQREAGSNLAIGKYFVIYFYCIFFMNIFLNFQLFIPEFLLVNFQ